MGEDSIMGLLSNILGKALGDAAADKLGKVITDAVSAAEKAASGAENAVSSARQGAAPAEPRRPASPGGSPYEAEPAEECQYNYDGSYAQYFEHVFSEDFPGFLLSRQSAYDGRATVFTFRQGGRKALVVELLSERSSVTKLRRECAAAGVPYLRFYYDHAGWWNTRSYVSGRVRAALG